MRTAGDGALPRLAELRARARGDTAAPDIAEEALGCGRADDNGGTSDDDADAVTAGADAIEADAGWPECNDGTREVFP